MIGVINSVLVGVLVGILASYLLGSPHYMTFGLGLVTFGISVEAHRRYQTRKFIQMDEGIHPLFPKEPAQKSKL